MYEHFYGILSSLNEKKYKGAVLVFVPRAFQTSKSDSTVRRQILFFELVPQLLFCLCGCLTFPARKNGHFATHSLKIKAALLLYQFHLLLKRVNCCSCYCSCYYRTRVQQFVFNFLLHKRESNVQTSLTSQ